VCACRTPPRRRRGNRFVDCPRRAQFVVLASNPRKTRPCRRPTGHRWSAAPPVAMAHRRCPQVSFPPVPGAAVGTAAGRRPEGALLMAWPSDACAAPRRSLLTAQPRWTMASDALVSKSRPCRAGARSTAGELADHPLLDQHPPPCNRLDRAGRLRAKAERKRCVWSSDPRCDLGFSAAITAAAMEPTLSSRPDGIKLATRQTLCQPR